MNKIALSFALLSISTVAGAFDFKGVEIGKPATPELIKEKLGVKCGIGANNMQVCNGYPTLLGRMTQMNLVIAADGLVQRISLTFDSGNFEATETALIEKFGKPTQTQSSKASNAMGATLDQVEHIWKDSDGNIVILKRYAGQIDESSLYFASPAEMKMFSEHSKQRAKDM